VAGAETSSVDIRLARSKTFEITGKVANPLKPSSGVQITLVKHANAGLNWDSIKRVMTDAKSTFVLRGVMPGSYDLQTVEFDANPPRFAMAQVTVGDSNVEGLEIAFGVNPEIKGVFSIENVPGQVQQSGSDQPAYRVSLYPEANMPMSGNTGGEVAEDGTFTFRNVMPLSYRISVYPLPGDAYVKQIVAGEKDLANGRVDFSGGVDAQEIKVVVSMNGAHLEGSVLDSKQEPSPRATVVAVPDQKEATQRYKSGTTDQNGHYVLRGLAPGKYKLYAFDQIDAGAFYDPDYMAAFESKAETIEVSEGSKLTHELQLIINDEMQ